MCSLRTSMIFVLATAATACNSPTAPVEAPVEPEPVREFFLAEWDSVLTVQYLRDSSLDGNHQIKIIRESMVPQWVLENAERLYPTRRMLEDLWSSPHSPFPVAIDTLPDSASVWWLGDFDGTRIPVANTAEAVQYYLDRSRFFQSNDYSGFMSASSFTYLGVADYWREFHGTDSVYQSVYVAQLTITWSQYCGMLCAMWFRSTRVVIFDGWDHGLLEVIGDGPEYILVS